MPRSADVQSNHTTNRCFGYEGKTGEERYLVIFKDTPNDHIDGELSTRPFR